MAAVTPLSMSLLTNTLLPVPPIITLWFVAPADWPVDPTNNEGMAVLFSSVLPPGPANICNRARFATWIGSDEPMLPTRTESLS